MHLPVAMGDPAAGAITCFPLQKLTVQQEMGPNCMSLGLEKRGVRGGVVLSGSPCGPRSSFPGHPVHAQRLTSPLRVPHGWARASLSSVHSVAHPLMG